MDSKRRKMNAQEIKNDFGSGGDWKDGLMSLVKDFCDVQIDFDIAGMIYDYSMGWWEVCVDCGEKTDGPCSRNQYNDYYCNLCQGNIDENVFIFNDD